jgi:C-terminal processing protease CtpA/Prc
VRDYKGDPIRPSRDGPSSAILLHIQHGDKPYKRTKPINKNVVKTSQTPVGIGVVWELKKKKQVLSVFKVVEGGGAHRAGIMPGDRLMFVDDTPVLGFTQEEIRPLIMGAEGTQVVLRIQRPTPGPGADGWKNLIMEEMLIKVTRRAPVGGTLNANIPGTGGALDSMHPAQGALQAP